MIRSFLTSTLRELRIFTHARRFWAVFALVIFLFAFTGPYGTSSSMPFGLRLAYWMIVHSVTWSIAISFSVAADVLLRHRIGQTLARMMIGSLAAALPIGFALKAIDTGFPGTWAAEGGSGLERALHAAPISMLFCLLTYLAMHRQIAEAGFGPVRREPEPPVSSAAAPVPPQASVPDLLRRLQPHNRAEIIRLSVQDHYTDVVTTKGRELVLLRFADAVKEMGGTAGLQVHRSHWVADAHVLRLKRDSGKLFVVTSDGAEIPVSRPNLDATRSRFGTRES